MLRPFHRSIFASLLIVGLLSLSFADAQEPKAKEPMLTAEQKEKLKERDRLIEETQQLTNEGKHKDGIIIYRKAIQIEKNVYGADHAIVEGSLETLAVNSAWVGEFDSAKQAREELLEWRVKKYGNDDWRTADAKRELADLDEFKKLSAADRKRLHQSGQLNREGVQLHAQRKIDEARIKLEEALTIRKQLRGPKHPDYAQSLKSLAGVYQTQGLYAQAEPLFRQALEIRKQALGEKHPDYATSLSNLAVLYQKQAKYAHAEPLFRQALAIRKQALGEKHPDYIHSLHVLALLYHAQGKYAQAEPLLRQTLEMIKESLGEKHNDYATALDNLAALYQAQGKYAEAEPLCRQALELRKETLGEKDPHYATSLNNLAALYNAQRLYAQAEPLCRQALAIYKQALGEKHPSYAHSLNNLAEFYRAYGMYAQAELLCREALAINKQVLGDKHPQYTSSLNNLAMLYKTQGMYGRAEPLFRQILEINKQVLGETHPDYVFALNNLGSLYHAQKLYAQAEPIYRQALEIRKQKLGEKHPHYAASLSNLAIFYSDQGLHAQAEPLYRQAMEITKKSMGENHPYYAKCLNNLALLLNAQGLYAQAEPLLLQAIRIDRELLAHSAAAQTEQQQQLHAQQMRNAIDNLCIVSFQKKEADVPRIYNEILAWKGAITARQRQTRLVRTILQSKPDADTTKLLTDLDMVSRQLATLSLSQPDPNKVPDLPKRLQELSDKRDQLEKDLSRKTAAFRKLRETQLLTLVDLQKLLPEDAVLVDFLEYQERDGKDRSSRLVAFVVTAKGIQRVELGKVEPLAQSIDRFRAPMKRARPITGKDDPALVLREMLWKPLEKYFNGAKLVLISPDGPLNRLPFAALPSTDGKRFLIEDYALAILPVPQLLPDLLERTIGNGPADADSVLLVGGVAFDGEVASVPIGGGRWAPRAGKLNAWLDLPGTTKEVESLNKMFGERFPTRKASLLQKIEASEEAVRQQIGRHRWVHLATHGFFSPPEVKAAKLDDEQSEGPKLIGHDPRLLSGIVLAGANRPPQPGRDDGILTALEVGDLDLTRVELAVLSACETGLGEVAGGEGVLGLQRAFQVAGAGSVATTLWQIPDEPTRILMQRFYENLWKGREGKKFSKLEALRESQLWMLKEGKSVPGIQRGLVRDDLPEPIKDGRLPPYYWAAFVLSGDWR